MYSSSISKQNSDLLKIHLNSNVKLVNVTGVVENTYNGVFAQIVMEISPTEVSNNTILIEGLIAPNRMLYFTLPNIEGENIPVILDKSGKLSVYYTYSTSNSRIDYTFTYLIG